MSTASIYLKSLEKIVGKEKFPLALRQLEIAKDFLNSEKRETLEKDAGNQIKSTILDDWFGSFLTDEVKHLLILLSDEGKLSLLNEIGEQTQLAKEVVITTAKPLSDQLKKWLIDELNKIAGALSFSWRQDPAILGGVKIKIGDQEIDNSLQTKLESLAFG